MVRDSYHRDKNPYAPHCAAIFLFCQDLGVKRLFVYCLNLTLEGAFKKSRVFLHFLEIKKHEFRSIAPSGDLNAHSSCLRRNEMKD